MMMMMTDSANGFTIYGFFCILLLILLVPVGMVYATESYDVFVADEVLNNNFHYVKLVYAESYDVFVTASDNFSGCEEDATCWSAHLMQIGQHDTVTWHNEQSYPVGVVSGRILDDDAGVLFDSGVILPNGSFSYTFVKSGSVEFFSPLQPWMSGTVTVKQSDDSSSGDDSSSSGDVPDGYVPEPIKEEPAKEMTCGPGTILHDGKCVAESAVSTDEKNNGDGGGCLIATAAYGTELAPQVQMLREIRDNQLSHTQSAGIFMESFNSLYYAFSPLVSDYQRENPIFREAVKIYITPMIYSLNVMGLADPASELSVVLHGLFVIVLNLLMYGVLPVGIVVAAVATATSGKYRQNNSR